mgnify:CR=1 FL=1
MDKLLHAIASPLRRQLMDIVRNQPGCNVNEASKSFDVSRIAVMKHLAVLEAANLIISEKQGRSRKLYFNPVPIQLIYERWTDEYSALWAGRLTDLKRTIEDKN